ARPSLWRSRGSAVQPDLPEPLPAVSFQRPTNERFWVSADYLASFMRPMRLGSPLLTTGATSDLHPGALGQPTTVVLVGNNSIDFGLLSGGSLAAGVYLDEQKRFSLEWRGFLYAPTVQTFATGS